MAHQGHATYRTSNRRSAFSLLAHRLVARTLPEVWLEAIIALTATYPPYPPER